ncbi:alpha/beta fold hydrolase [Microtetraspora niveoalba]|uniref:alpha/beta fold hydrolase n=1 Tax=Microtetraspora niveoalba TaxID=46175 RepID=UPI0008348296|nr:alpha/beta hydrolase [Microtetraspora niveoalba]
MTAHVYGDGFPLIGLSWFGLDGAAMAAAVEPALPEATPLQRIYPDLPGCGRTPGGPKDSDGVVDAVLEFLDTRIGSRRFLLAGCSYGGYIAAAVTRRRPEQVAGLMLICSGVKIRPEDRELPEPPDRPAPEGWLSGVPDDLREHLSLALGDRTGGAAERVAAVLTSSASRDDEYLARLRATGYQLSDEGAPSIYRGPTTVVSGRQDRIAGYADQFRALSSFPYASFSALADAGHYLPFERPDAFRDLVREWLARCHIGR